MVGTRKNKSDKWMPPRVYRGKSRYEYRPKGGGTVKLCKRPKDGVESESLKAQVWAEYAKAKERPPIVYDVDKLIAEYHASPQLKSVSRRTQQDYERYSKRVSRVFGHMEPVDVEPHHIRMFMDKLGEQGKHVTANRHHSYMSVLFGWALERNKVQRNPAKSVRKFKETPRDRYIEDSEYNLVLQVARDSNYPYVAPMMELAYLCRLRSVEVRKLTADNLTEDGIFVERAKGSENEVTGWSPRLEAAVAEARALFPKAPSNIQRPLFHGRQGRPIPAETLKTAWGRVMRKAVESGLRERFTFHDIKAKGISDHGKRFGGHRDKKMQAVYNRKPNVVEPTR